MFESFRALYGKTVTVQWHFGNSPDRPATSFHMSCEGPKQGDAPATVYFNVLAGKSLAETTTDSGRKRGAVCSGR